MNPKLIRCTQASLMMLLFASCTTIYESTERQTSCIFNIQATSSSETGAVSKLHGVYVYLNSANGAQQPFDEVTIAVFREGREVEFFGGGTALSRTLLGVFRSAELPDVDYVDVIERAVTRAGERRGARVVVFDGAEYEVRLEYEGSKCRFRMWNPIPYIDEGAAEDPLVARLKVVIDAVLLEVGKNAIGI